MTGCLPTRCAGLAAGSDNLTFSSMDAPSLLGWVRSEQVESLGSNVNRWLRVIDVASQRSVHARSTDERATFREAALLAIERAQRAGALSAFESTRRKLRLRARYMRTGNFEPAWLREEASAIFELASDSLPTDVSSAARLAELRRDRDSWLATDPEARRSLEQAIALVRPVNHILYYLDSRERAAIQPWLDLMSEYDSPRETPWPRGRPGTGRSGPDRAG